MCMYIYIYIYSFIYCLYIYMIILKADREIQIDIDILLRRLVADPSLKLDVEYYYYHYYQQYYCYYQVYHYDHHYHQNCLYVYHYYHDQHYHYYIRSNIGRRRWVPLKFVHSSRDMREIESKLKLSPETSCSPARKGYTEATKIAMQFALTAAARRARKFSGPETGKLKWVSIFKLPCCSWPM